MWCPSCGSDHRPDVTTCPECGERLVEALPPEDHQGSELVLVWEGSDPDELPLVESLLQDAGIPFVVQGEEAFGVLPLTVTGVRVMVPEPQAAEAARVLESGDDSALE